MDFVDALKAGGASATIIAIVAIVYKIISSICGHRVRSECCGKEGSIGIVAEAYSSQSHPTQLPPPANPNPPSPVLRSVETPEHNPLSPDSVRPKRPSAQVGESVGSESHLTEVAGVESSPSHIALSIVPAIEPLVLPPPLLPASP